MRFHGGSLRARLDFSVNTNPLGPPEELYTVIRGGCDPEDVLRRYPDYSYRDLRRSLSEFYGVEEDMLIPLNGSSEGLILALLAIRPSKMISIEPTFGDHGLACRSLGMECIHIKYREAGDSYNLDRDALERLADLCRDPSALIYMSNPNNPTGVYIDIEKLYDLFSGSSCYVIVDEAYAELCSRCPLKPEEPPDNILILRSLTKWLSIPGLRLGFIITSSKKMWDTLEGIRPPWNVNSLAECSISMLLSRYSENMRSFIERSRAYIDQEKRYLIDDLRKAGVPRIYRGEANYVLSWLGEHIDSIMLGLVKRGISLRDCSSFTGLGKGYVRISVRRREDNEELIGAMRSLLKGLMSSEEYS